MKYLYQFLIIIGFSFVGEMLNWLIPLPVPASIYGIILLFGALQAKLLRVKDVKEVCTFLIAVMPVMFLPPAVGLLKAWPVIGSKWVEYVAITVLSTFVVMAVAGWTTQWFMHRSRKEVGDE